MAYCFAGWNGTLSRVAAAHCRMVGIEPCSRGCKMPPGGVPLGSKEIIILSVDVIYNVQFSIMCLE